MSIKAYFKKEVKTVFTVKYKRKLCLLIYITESSALMHYSNQAAVYNFEQALQHSN